MCIGALFKKPDIPKPVVAPTAPTVDEDAIRRRQLEEEARLAGLGSAGTVKTDLSPSAVAGAQKRVKLGV